jgi:peptidoglycan/LPS O-acetylase OafA/YrhL
LLLKEKAENGKVNLRAFYVRRILRTFPAFYCYLIVLTILNFYLDLEIPTICLLSAGLYVHNFHPWGSNWFVNHTWSLAVEEQFYLLWPFIFRYIRKVGISIWFAVLLFGCIIRCLQYKFPELSNYLLAPFFAHADFLFSGCFLAYMSFYHHDRVVAFVKQTKSFFVYCAIFAIWICTAFEYHPDYDRIFIPVSGIIINVCISFLLVYFISKNHSLGYKILNYPAVTFVGRLSYSLYLWQQLFLAKSNFWFLKFPFNIVLTLLTAYISYIVVEKPFLKLKEKFR